jgi:hypothetical protein
LHSFFCNGNISAPWVKFAKDTLDNCGLSNVWTFQNKFAPIRYYSSFYIYVKWKATKLAVYHKIWRALLQASKLSAISYKLLHSFFCNGNISAPWVKFAKDILDNCGLSNVWTQGADIFPLQKKLCKSL